MDGSRKMWAMNVEPSIMAAHLAVKLGAANLVLTGAKAVVHGTPDMVGYGMAKKAVVHLTQSVASQVRSLCILPYYMLY